MAANGRANADGALLAALASGSTVQAAAELASVSARTAARRLAEPGFRRELDRCRAEMLERALGHVAAGAADAATTLRNLLTSEDERVKLSAARALLELGPKLRDAVELEERLRRLEERATK